MTDARHWRRIVGIDPGNSGGIITLTPLRRGSRDWSIHHVFKLERGELEIAEHLKTVLATGEEEVVYLEKVQGWGVARSFNFGMYYGFVRGVIRTCGAKLVDVHPQTWMKAMGVQGKSQTKEKKQSMRSLAEAIQSDVSTTNWNAAAILIAAYGLNLEGGRLINEHPQADEESLSVPSGR